MVTRRNAVSQVVGFMSLENGLVLAATGAKGMPLVVEISVAFSILIAFIVIGIFLFRIRERFDTVDRARARPDSGESDDERASTLAPVRRALLVDPAREPRASWRSCRAIGLGRALNVAASFLTLLAALSLLFGARPAPGTLSAGRRPQHRLHCCSTPSSASRRACSARAISRTSSRPAG